MTRLGDLVDMTFGFAFKSSDFTAARDDVRLLRGDNVSQGNLRWEGEKLLPSAVAKDYSEYLLRTGDVVLAMDRPWIEAGLKYSVVREADVPSLLVQRVARLRAREPLDQRYLSYIIGSQSFTDHVRGVQTGTTVPHISGKQIGEYDLGRLPTLVTQRGIAATLGALDDKIGSNSRSQLLVEQIVIAEFDLAFSAENDPLGVAVSDLVDINPQRRLVRGEVATYVGMAALPENSAEVDNWTQRSFGAGQRFLNGDVLMARVTPCLENGKTAVVDMLQPGEVGWGSTEYIILAPKGAITTPWIYCLVRSEPVRSFAIRSMTGTSGRQRFQADGFDKYHVPAPDPIRLDRFNNAAVPLFEQMTALRDQNRRLRALRDTLLPNLLSGRIRVPEADQTVERVVT